MYYFLYIAASLVILGNIWSYDYYYLGSVDQYFVLEMVCAFSAITIGLTAFNLSIQNRNRIVTYIGAAYISTGILDFVSSLYVNGILFAWDSPVYNFLFNNWLLGRIFFTLILLVGIIQVRRSNRHSPSLPVYVGVVTFLAVASLLILVYFDVPTLFFETDSLIIRPLEYIPLLFSVVIIVAVFKPVKGANIDREMALLKMLLPALILSFSGSALMSASEQLFDAAFMHAHIFKVFSNLVAIIPMAILLWQYARYSIEISGARLVTMFSVVIVGVLFYSVIQHINQEHMYQESDSPEVMEMLRDVYVYEDLLNNLNVYYNTQSQDQKRQYELNWIKQEKLGDKLYMYLDYSDSDTTNKVDSALLRIKALSEIVFDENRRRNLSNKEFVLRAENIHQDIQGVLHRLTFKWVDKLKDRRKNALSILNHNLEIFLALVALALPLLYLANAWHSKKQISPVLQLADMATRITKGEQFIRIASDRQDEIGILSNSFNSMAKSIQTSFERLEVKVEERTRQLKMSEQWIRDIMDNIQEGIITMDNTGTIKFINPAVQKMFGYQDTELLNQPISKLFPDLENNKHLTDLVNNDHISIPPILVQPAFRETGVRRSGDEFPVELSINIVTRNGNMILNTVVRDITELLRAEIILRESEERMARFFTASREGLVMHQDGIIVDANEAAVVLMRSDLKSLVGQHINQFINVEDKKLFRTDHENVSSELFESVLSTGNDLVPIEFQALVIKQKNRSIGVVVVRDITERKAAEAALSKQYEFTQKILETIGSLVMVIDSEGRVIHTNKACELCSGFKHEELASNYFWDVMGASKSESNELNDIVEYSKGIMFPLRRQFTWVTKDNSSKVIDWIMSPIMADDKSIEYIIAAGVDVTEILMIQEKLASEQRNLEIKVKERTRELDAVFTLSPDGFVVFNDQGILVFANPAFLEISGLKQSDILEKNFDEFKEVLFSLCDVTWLKDTGKLDFTQDRTILELARPAKKVLSFTSRKIKDEHGSPQGYVNYIRDITHESEVDKMKSEFLSTAAHEFRTPLSSILGFSELLLNNNNIEMEKLNRLIEIIHRQSVHLKHLLDELLDIARIETRAGKDFSIIPDSLEQTFCQVCEEMRALSDNHDFQFDQPDTWPLVPFDREKMIQVLKNVIGNAYKYSPDGGKIRCYTITREQGERQLFGIAVKDSGIGMSPEEVARVGERFYRADTSGSIPGTGLGMAIVLEIMKIQNGEVEIDSQKGQGTTVTLWLPVINDKQIKVAV